MANQVIYIASNNLLSLTGCRESATGSYLNEAEVAYSIQEPDGTVIGSGTLDYVTESDGDYEAILDASVSALLVNHGSYFVVFSFDQASTYKATFRVECKAKYQ